MTTSPAASAPAAPVHVTYWDADTDTTLEAAGSVWHTYTHHGDSVVEVYVTGRGVLPCPPDEVHPCPPNCQDEHPAKTRRYVPRLHMTMTSGPWGDQGHEVTCRCGWHTTHHPSTTAARIAGDAHLATANHAEG